MGQHADEISELGFDPGDYIETDMMVEAYAAHAARACGYLDPCPVCDEMERMRVNWRQKRAAKGRRHSRRLFASLPIPDEEKSGPFILGDLFRWMSKKPKPCRHCGRV